MENFIGGLIFLAFILFVVGKLAQMRGIELPWMRDGFWGAVLAVLAGAVAWVGDLIGKIGG